MTRVRTSKRNCCKQRGSCESGQASVEIAGALPILVMMVVLLVQGFMLMAAVSDIRDAARDGARAVAAHQSPYGAVSASLSDWISLDSVSGCGAGCVRVSGHAPLGIPGVVTVAQVPLSAQASFRVPER